MRLPRLTGGAARRVSLCAALLLLAGCNEAARAGDPAPVQPAPPPARAAEADPAARASAPPLPGRADFAIAGELTQGGWLRGAAPSGTVRLTLDGTPVPLAPDGTFLIAFDRDAGAGAVLRAELSTGGGAVSRTLQVTPRAWNIEHVNVARRSGGPTEAFMKLRRPELAMIDAARRKQTDAQGWRQNFVWPVTGRISGRFGSQRIYRGEPGSYHSGTDITTGASGTPFVAPADGVVILAADHPFTLEGNLLMLDHGMGLSSAFLHCSQILVKEGEHVRRGQVIGRIGATGRATGPHLHWGMKWNAARLDPMLFAGPMR